MIRQHGPLVRVLRKTLLAEMALIFGAAAFIYAQSEVWRWGAASVGTLVGLVSMIAQRRNQIRMTVRGEDLFFDFADIPEVVNAFIFSLRERMRESNSIPPAPGEADDAPHAKVQVPMKLLAPDTSAGRDV